MIPVEGVHYSGGNWQSNQEEAGSWIPDLETTHGYTALPVLELNVKPANPLIGPRLAEGVVPMIRLAGYAPVSASGSRQLCDHLWRYLGSGDAMTWIDIIPIYIKIKAGLIVIAFLLHAYTRYSAKGSMHTINRGRGEIHFWSVE